MPTPINSTEDFGRAIRTVRQERGLTQEELALTSGTGRRFIGDLEQGKPTIRLDATLRVVQALGLELVLSDPLPPMPPRAPRRRGRP